MKQKTFFIIFKWGFPFSNTGKQETLETETLETSQMYSKLTIKTPE